MDVTGIDHLVLYVEDVEATCEFYTDTLGTGEIEHFAGGRTAISFGTTKLNLHPAGDEYDPHAASPETGAGDFCLLVEEPIADVADRIEDAGVPIVEGPVSQTGARGEMRSVYVRDPDGNLVEFARYA